MLDKDLEMIEESSQKLLNLALGGTAVGTGINTKKNFRDFLQNKLQRIQDILLSHLIISSMH